VRRSLHAAKDIAEGEVITEDLLVSKRPGFGVPIYLKGILIGRSAKKAIPKDSWISWDLV
jgi:sialic acid synthase SpsE